MSNRWRIATENRVGMALDVLTIISGAGIDIGAMEVLPGLAFLRLEGTLTEAVKERLLAMPGVVAVEPVPLLPQEERQQEVDAVLEAVSDGVLVVRPGGAVAGLNPAAARILAITEQKAIGQEAAAVLGTDRLLHIGSAFDNEEVRVQTPRGRLHYVASGRALGDSDGHTGIVLALKSMQEARALVHSLTRPQGMGFADITSSSKLMADVIRLAQAACRVDATVLLQGESGTGKEIFARAIHSESGRGQGPFVPINCAALPETLLESELFGYEEGSFTGAKRGGKQGIFEFAHGGTVFLDEVGELPGHLQAKLLRALQEGRVRRVGGREEIPVDVRVLAATNRNLRSMVADRQFRDDLYYRLNVIPIVIPPLRERQEDIDALSDHMINKWSARMGREAPALSAEARRRLHEYPWPGNVRELENAVERALALTLGPEIGPEQLMLEGAAGTGPTPAAQGTLRERLAEVERQILADMMTRTGSARRAAQALDVSHTTILNKLHKLGLSHLLKE
ncbi:MAG TPA: sigma 54-interacting transcriptional regulator [Symbiobacteriaceae bacterium]|jgi:transcriptional regulator of aroF, aroG, tyrA and aromatic amino acid transport